MSLQFSRCWKMTKKHIKNCPDGAKLSIRVSLNKSAEWEMGSWISSGYASKWTCMDWLRKVSAELRHGKKRLCQVSPLGSTAIHAWPVGQTSKNYRDLSEEQGINPIFIRFPDTSMYLLYNELKYLSSFGILVYQFLNGVWAVHCCLYIVPAICGLRYRF